MATPKTICFDIDGTICEQRAGDYENAAPLSSAREVVNKLYDEGYRIVFHTARYMGRFDNNYDQAYDHGYEFTFKQLQDWGFKFHELHFGKPFHDLLIDDKAVFFNPDWDAIYRAIKSKSAEPKETI